MLIKRHSLSAYVGSMNKPVASDDGSLVAATAQRRGDAPHGDRNERVMQQTGAVVCPCARNALTMIHFIRSASPWETAQRLCGGRLESMLER